MSSILYTQENFISSTPIRTRPQQRSFTTSLESRGYGTMKSRIYPGESRCPNPYFPKSEQKINVSRENKDQNSSGEMTPLAPPCSINNSIDDLDQFDDSPHFSFTNPNDYDDVFESSNPPDHHDFQCLMCDQTFYTHLEYLSHQEKHLLCNSTAPVKIRCEKCGKKMKNKMKLKLHQDKIHPSEMVILMVL